MEIIGPLGFGFGAFGFLVTVRNAIEKILINIDQWKKWSQDLVPLMSEIETFQGELQDWQAFWYLDDRKSKTPFLLEAFWGQDGSRAVVDILVDIRIRAESIKETFNKVYGERYQKVRWDWKKTPNSERIISLQRASDELEARLKDFRQNAGLLIRTRAVLYQSQIFAKNLESIQKDFRRLNLVSQREFLKKNRAGDSHKWEDKVREIATGTLLPLISADFAEHGEELQQCLRNIAQKERVQLDLHLNHGLDPEERQHMLITFAQANIVQTQLHMRNKHSHTESCVNLRSRVATQASSRLEPASGRTPVVSDGRQTVQPNTAPVGEIDDREQCVIERISVECQVKNPRNIREMVGRGVGTLLTDKETIELRYELLEFALFFLRSGWLRSICSCAVHRFAKYPTRQGVFTMNLDCRHRLAPIQQQGIVSEAWCSTILKTKPLWRLGLLLIEVCLNQAVSTVGHRKADGKLVALFYSQAREASGMEPSRVCEDEMDEETDFEIRNECEDLADTINFCLSLKSVDLEDEASFRNFYEEAVFP